MLDGSNNSELWLMRTCFDHDAAWNALEADARTIRSQLPESSLIVSSDRTQCQQRVRRIMTRLASRAQANSQFYVAIADKQTFGHPDRLLLTIDCSPMPHTVAQLPFMRLAPQRAFRMGTADRQPSSGHGIDSSRISLPQVGSAVTRSQPAIPGTADHAALVSDAIRSSQLWKRAMAREITDG